MNSPSYKGRDDSPVTSTRHGVTEAECAVVIPYFQREGGLLVRAIRSALEQHACLPHVFVVDDGSPAPAASELSRLTPEERRRITLIKQPNAGPSAARNRALDEIPESTKFVAFLDSDDTWDPHHLERATRAFGIGANIYFADHIREGAGQSRFTECGVSAASGSQIEPSHRLYRFEANLFSAILRKSPIGTSTLVYQRKLGRDLRFREDLSAGEDTLFWLSLVSRSSFQAFSTNCDAKYGRGVNIFAGATWGTPQALRYLADSAKMHRLAARLFPLVPELRRWNDGWLRELRQSYALNLLHLARQGAVSDWKSLVQYLVAEPRLGLDLVRLGMGNLGRVLRAATPSAPKAFD